MAKRRGKVIGPVPDILPTDKRYLNIDAMVDDVRKFVGRDNLSQREIAHVLGFAQQNYTRLLATQTASIQLESYVRACARLRLPLGSWINTC